MFKDLNFYCLVNRAHWKSWWKNRIGTVYVRGTTNSILLHIKSTVQTVILYFYAGGDTVQNWRQQKVWQNNHHRG